MSYQSDRVYEDSYKELNRIQKENTGDRVSIYYNKLDETTRSELRDAISAVIRKRKPEMFRVMQGAKSGTR